jgi:hypothetical protein
MTVKRDLRELDPTALEWVDDPNTLETVPKNSLSELDPQHTEYFDQHPDAEPSPSPSPEPGLLHRFGKQTLEDLPELGMMAGGTLGGVATAPSGGLGAFPGAAAGGYLGSATKNLINTYANPKEAPQHSIDYLTEPAKKAALGVATEGIGQKVGELTSKHLAPVVSKYAGPVYNAIKDKVDGAANAVLRKGAKIGHGMQESFTQRFLKEKGKLNPRESHEIMNDLQGRHDFTKAQVETTKEAVKDQKNALNNQLADQRFQAGNKAAEANLNYSEAKNLHQEGLRNLNLRELREPIEKAIAVLQKKVNDGSKESYSILDHARGSINTAGLKQVIRDGMEHISLNSKATTPTDRDALNHLSQALELYEKQPENISLGEAKFLIQRLDKDIYWPKLKGAYEEIANGIKKQARDAIDTELKNKVPKYKSFMKGVDADTTLLAEVSKRFGDPALSLSRLENLSSPRGEMMDADLIRQLGKETGFPFDGVLERYFRGKDILKSISKQKEIFKSLPQHQARQEAQAEVRRLSDPAIRRKVNERMNKSKELRDYNDARAKHEPFSQFSQGHVQSKVNSLNGARDFNPGKLFTAADEATGHNFTQEITDRAILDAFEKTDTAGSRKTLAGKIIGKFIGMLVGGVAGAVTGKASGLSGALGAASGTAIGFSMDKYSGQVLRSILNGKINMANGVQALERQFGKYAPELAEAAERGPQALAILIEKLADDEEFRQKLEQ